MRILYLDCFSGISGDMFIGACVDAGVDQHFLRESLAKLSIREFTIEFERVQRCGIAATKARVRVTSDHKDHIHRHLKDIEEIIGESSLSENVKGQSLAVFRRLAEAEASVHGTSIDQIHFHEVGAVDAIVDIVSAAICVEALGVEAVYTSPVSLGGGTVRCAHGVLPVPAPATAKLLEGFPVKLGPVEMELATPTGAAIVSTLCSPDVHVPEFSIKQTGFGAGDRDTKEVPNVLRVIVGETCISTSKDEIVILEANVDDMTAETAGYVLERCFAAGALDVYMIPVTMKKSRPGLLIGVLVPPRLEKEIAQLLLTETSTFGLRRIACDRYVLPRSVMSVQTPWGDVRVKIGEIPSGKKIAPEYDDCQRCAKNAGVPLWNVYEAAKAAALENLKS